MSQEELELFELYEQYLDEEIIAQINEEDNEEFKKEEQKRSSKTEAKFPPEASISISEFVNNYLGIRADCSTLWHSGLKELGSSYVFGVDNNFANKNPDLVYTGELLLVVDAKGNRGTYINPRYIQQLLTKEDIEKELRVLRKKGTRDLEHLEAYIQECQRLQAQVDNNQKLYELLRETHKVRKFNELKEEEGMRHGKF